MDLGFPAANRSEDVVVGSGVEVTCPTSVFCNGFAVLLPGESIDVSDTSILFTFNSSAPFPTASFVGFIFTSLDFSPATAINGVSLITSGLTGLTSTDLTFGASSISVNFAGVLPSIGGAARIDFTTRDVPTVPEPTSLSLLAFGLTAVAIRRRRERS